MIGPLIGCFLALPVAANTNIDRKPCPLYLMGGHDLLPGKSKFIKSKVST
jgi:hypothetical protein